MPVVIAPQHFETWLTTTETETKALQPLLEPAANNHFTLTPTTIIRPRRPVKQPETPRPKPAADQLKLL